MCCSANNGSLLAGTQTRFFFTQSDPVLRFKPTRVPIGSFKIKAKINDALVKESAGMSLYNLLGIPESGTLPEIKQAYKQLARKYHPDVSPPDRVEEYTKQFIRVQQAYETLSDPRRRAMYDRDMSKGLHLAFSARKRYQNDVVLCLLFFFFNLDFMDMVVCSNVFTFDFCAHYNYCCYCYLFARVCFDFRVLILIFVHGLD